MSSSENNKRVRRNRVRKIWYRLSVIAFVFGLTLLIVCGVLTYKAMEEVQTQGDLRNLYHSTNAPEADATQETTAEVDAVVAEETNRPLVLQKDFEELYQINSDMVGWFSDGEGIDGPVLYRDNEYYMNHNIYGKSTWHGEIFVDEACEDWLTDPYVILYGHNMKNGTVFGSLKSYRDAEFLKQNPVMEFRTIYDEQPTLYVPFALFDADVSEKNNNYFYLRRFSIFDNENTEEIQSFLDEIQARSLYDIPVDVTTEDRIIALVTCSYTDKNGRLMVFMREARDGETRESIADLMASIGQN